MRAIALIMLLSITASASRVSRSGTGSSDCRSVKVLAIGGELQPNTWDNCGKDTNHGINSDWYKQKVAAERDEYKHKQEAEKSKRKADAEARRDKKVRDCHGVGAAADCTGANPGHTTKKVDTLKNNGATKSKSKSKK